MVRYCFDIDLVADTCPAVEEGILAEDNPEEDNLEDILGVDSLEVGTLEELQIEDKHIRPPK